LQDCRGAGNRYFFLITHLISWPDKHFTATNALQLIDYGVKTDYAHTIQSFHRFLIDHLSSEGNVFPHNPVLLKNHPNSFQPLSPAAAPVTQLLGVDARNVITCMSCKAVREKENMTHVVDLIYPRKVTLFSFIHD
jgi:hypothetical protein